MLDLDALEMAARYATKGRRYAKITNIGWIVRQEDGDDRAIAMLYTPMRRPLTLPEADAEAGANAALVALLDPETVLEIVRRLRSLDEATGE